ncbi:MAG: hypothetical protein O3C40_32590 [Planctomycetota bacterium]|nr:hypothetical protein [Planctomycetota bacterium]
MKHFALVGAILVLSAGCRAPMPNCNMFGPYGATRVPPPPTGGYGAPQSYYTPRPTTVPPTSVPSTISPTSTPVGTGFRPSPSNRWSNIDDPAIGPIAQDNTWAPTRPAISDARVVDLRDLDVALASHATAIPSVPSTVVVEHDGPIRILSSESSTANAELPRLRGMFVNDVTRVAEPRPFVPSGRVIDISQLPDAPVAARTAQTQSSQAASQSSTRQATVIDGGWKTRTTTLRVAGT